MLTLCLEASDFHFLMENRGAESEKDVRKSKVLPICPFLLLISVEAPAGT